jgi:hypothetical protein
VGGDGDFDFTTDYGSPFQLSNGENNNSGWIATGSHSVSETVPTGWDLTSVTCNDDEGTNPRSNPVSLQLDADEIITCTFTNTKLGKITIVKDADPNDCQDFAFSGTNPIGSFSLDDDQGVQECSSGALPNNKSFSNLPVNTSYTVAETIPNQYWVLKSITCVNTADGTPYTDIVSTTNGTIITLDPGADVTCTFLNEKLSPTRTLGFWQTHTAYTSSTFATYFASGMQIGSTSHKGLITNDQSTGASQLFGGFYASIPKTTLGVKRSDVDKARMQLLQQLIAAKLNCAAFGCSTSVQTMISDADTAYANGNLSAIRTSAGLLDGYNNSGDTLIIGNAGKATPKTSQSYANLVFWNLP